MNESKKRNALLTCALYLALASQAHGYDPGRKITGIRVPEDVFPVAGSDYFEASYSDPCDFEEGDTEGIVVFGAGLKDIRVSGGSLCFSTGQKDNFFFWGNDDFGHPDARIEKIGAGWPMTASCFMRMRIKQSLPSSSWVASVRRHGSWGMRTANAKSKTTSFKVEGQDWQTVDFDVGIVGGRNRYHTLRLQTKEDGNEIEIDSIEISPTTRNVFYRRTYDFPCDVATAALSVAVAPSYILYVNGEQVAASDWIYNPVCVSKIDIGRYLKKGKNVIALQTEAKFQRNSVNYRGDTRMTVRGMAILSSGEFRYLLSDESWKYSLEEHDGWESADFEDSEWQKAATCSPSDPVGSVHYFGRIFLNYGGRRSPIYGEDEGIRMRISVPFEQDTTRHLSYRLVNSFTGQEVGKGDLPLVRSDTELVHEFSYSPGKMGVWQLHVTLKDGEGREIDNRYQEIAVVGKIEQKEVAGESFTEGMDLTLVADIDCADDNDPHFRGDSKKKGSSHTVDSPLGKYRETGSAAWNFFSYKYKPANLYKPHVIEVTYPDDGKRTILIDVTPAKYVNHGQAVSYRRFGAATFAGGRYPNTHTMKKMYYLYWPCHEEDVIDVKTWMSGAPAAAARIRVYEIKDIPALKGGDSSGRLIGQFTEREPILLNNFYSGPDAGSYPGRAGGVINPIESNLAMVDYRDFYKNWFIVTENLIKYMRFSGENLYVPGVFMYSTFYYPTTRGRQQIAKDHMDLTAKFFEYNNLCIALGIQWGNTYSLLKKDCYTDEDVAKGGDTLRLVSRFGEQQYNFLTSGGFNYFHPAVEKEVYETVRDLIDLYKDYPAIKGLWFYDAGQFFPGMMTIRGDGKDSSPYDWGYGDTTIRMFEEDTGVRTPGKTADPERFGKRYEFLMSPEYREKWRDWRCRKVYSQVKTISDMARETGTVWDMYVFPYGGFSDIETRCAKGWDTRLYTDRDIVLMDAKPEQNFSDAAISVESLYAQNRNEALPGCFGVYFARGGVPPHGWATVPRDEYLREFYCRQMAFSDPLLFGYGKADVLYIFGGEQGLRPFIRAYRSLPQGDYRNLEGNGLDKNIIIRAFKNKRTVYCYVLNSSRYPVATTLVFASNSPVRDLITDEELVLQEERVTLSLEPYSLRTLAFENRLLSAQTEIPGEAAELAREKLQPFKSFSDIPAERMAELLKGWGIKREYEDFRGTITAMEDACKDGHYLKVIDMADRRDLKTLMKYTSLYVNRKEPPKPQSVYRVICGKNEPFTDAEGNAWHPDRKYVFGVDSYGYIGPAEKSAYRGNIEIENAGDQEIYRSERYGMSQYCFAVPKGRYTVKLLFCETYYFTKWKRLFDVTIEDKKVLQNLDIFGEAGKQTALVKTFRNIEVNDGELNIVFSPVKWSSVNGIEVRRE